MTLIESGTLGGTCVNVGCVPSKVSLRATQVAHTLRSHPFRGLPHLPTLAADRQAQVAQQTARVEELRQAKYQDILDSTPGITLLRGQARFADAHTLIVKGERGKGSEGARGGDEAEEAGKPGLPYTALPQHLGHLAWVITT